MSVRQMLLIAALVLGLLMVLACPPRPKETLDHGRGGAYLTRHAPVRRGHSTIFGVSSRRTRAGGVDTAGG